MECNVVTIDFHLVEVRATIQNSTKKNDFEVQKFPVLRVFGSTRMGQSVCAHLHGFFPYFYFRPESFDDLTFLQKSQIERYIPNFKSKLNQGLKSKYAKEGSSSDVNYIYNMQVVKSTPMYGFYPTQIWFIKVQLYDPDLLSKAAHLIEDGLFGTPMQPYESHIPYILKFTSDYSVTPMGYINLGHQCKFRTPLPQSKQREQAQTHTRTSLACEGSSYLVSAISDRMQISRDISPHNINSVVDLDNSKSPCNLLNALALKNHWFNDVITECSLPNDNLWTDLNEISMSTRRQFRDALPLEVREVLEGLSTQVVYPDGPPPDVVIKIDPDKNCNSTPTSSRLRNPITLPGSELATIYARYYIPLSANIQQKCNDVNSHGVFVVNKTSTCDLEIDVHVDTVNTLDADSAEIVEKDSQESLKSIHSQILSGFGAELWKEEAKRRVKDGLPAFEIVHELPSDFKRQWPKYENEKDLEFRYHRLLEKGRLLYEIENADNIKLNQNTHGGNCMDISNDELNVSLDVPSDRFDPINDLDVEPSEILFQLSQFYDNDNVESNRSSDIERVCDGGRTTHFQNSSTDILNISNCSLELVNQTVIDESFVGESSANANNSKCQDSDLKSSTLIDSFCSRAQDFNLQVCENNKNDNISATLVDHSIPFSNTPDTPIFSDLPVNLLKLIDKTIVKRQQKLDMVINSSMSRLHLTASGSKFFGGQGLDSTVAAWLTQQQAIENDRLRRTFESSRHFHDHTISQNCRSQLGMPTSLVLQQSEKEEDVTSSVFLREEGDHDEECDENDDTYLEETNAILSCTQQNPPIDETDFSGSTKRIEVESVIVGTASFLSESKRSDQSIMRKRVKTEQNVQTGNYLNSENERIANALGTSKSPPKPADVVVDSSQKINSYFCSPAHPTRKLTVATAFNKRSQSRHTETSSEWVTSVDASANGRIGRSKSGTVKVRFSVSKNLSLSQSDDLFDFDLDYKSSDLPPAKQANFKSALKLNHHSGASPFLPTEYDINGSILSSGASVLENVSMYATQYMSNDKLHKFLVPSFPSPPNAEVLMRNLKDYSIPYVVNTKVFYGDSKDCPDGVMNAMVGGVKIAIKSSNNIPEFEHSINLSGTDDFNKYKSRRLSICNQAIGPSNDLPPSVFGYREVIVLDGADDGEIESSRVVYNVDNDSVEVTYQTVPPEQRNSRTYLLMSTFLPPSPASSLISIASESYSNGLAGSNVTTPAITDKDKSQVSTPTQTCGVKHYVMKDDAKVNLPLSNSDTSHLDDTKNNAKKTYIRVCSMEIFSTSRINNKLALTPDPKYDSIDMITYVIEEIISSTDSETKRARHGIITVIKGSSFRNISSEAQVVKVSSAASTVPPLISSNSQFENMKRAQINYIKSCELSKNLEIFVEANETDLFRRFHTIFCHSNIDFIVGYEIQNASFGYFIQRGMMLDTPIDCLQLLSCIPSEKASKRNEFDIYAEQEDSGIFITGRIVINIWKIMRSELKLANYSYNNVAQNILKRKIPSFSNLQLSTWFQSVSKQKFLYKHMMRITKLNLELLDSIDFFRRTSESARLYGIDFYSVISRGSQYRVEATLLRVAHKLGYIAVSPSKLKVANQAPMAVIPLVMEPRSQFYDDPVIVLDYQSLYPSMIIAYNLCYSTILGKVIHGRLGENDTQGTLGASNYPESLTAAMAYKYWMHRHQNCESTGQRDFMDDDLYDVTNQTFLSPNGSIFCSKAVRQGILPLMLKDILETRFMIKRAMKRYEKLSFKSSSATTVDYEILKRVLDARQLSIKMLANVTYGYAGAGFSGRMPMAELADAIVQCGRTTLEWTRGYIEKHALWNAKVVYGDTDSVFVNLPGRTKDQAIELGNEMAKEITSLCPPGVVLKYEKVYFPCILASKKRYVGRSFETTEQVHGHFDAKGIEAVRRDQCPMTIKMQEKAIRILFDTRDLSQVKSYLLRQWDKIHMGHQLVPLRDFIFSKEVKLGHYRGLPPPGAEVAAQNMVKDPMSKPPYQWRVPYVVVYGSQNSRLVDLAVNPIDLLKRGNSLKINSVYYITKCINPALERVIGLAGADVSKWYLDMKKKRPVARYINYEDFEIPNSSIRNPKFHISTVSRTSSSHTLPTKLKQQSMDSFTLRGECVNCGMASNQSLCQKCQLNPSQAYFSLCSKLSQAEKAEEKLKINCDSCSMHVQHKNLNMKNQIIGMDSCENISCEHLFDRWKHILKLEDYEFALSLIIKDFIRNPTRYDW